MRACIRVLHMKHGVWRLAFARGGDGVDRVVVMMTVMVMVVGPRVIAMGCGDSRLREEVMVVVVMMRVVVMVVGPRDCAQWMVEVVVVERMVVAAGVSW